jgi:hypothetical protein
MTLSPGNNLHHEQRQKRAPEARTTPASADRDCASCVVTAL